MPKGGRRGTQRKVKRVEEGLNESFENQSTASSQGSFDTQSNPADDVESNDELGTEAEEVETNFEQVLEENIEGATEKNTDTELHNLLERVSVV